MSMYSETADNFVNINFHIVMILVETGLDPCLTLSSFGPFLKKILVVFFVAEDIYLSHIMYKFKRKK